MTNTGPIPDSADADPADDRVMISSNSRTAGRISVGRLIGACAVLVLAIVSLVGGSWALWKDRVSRDSDGYVSIGSTELSADVYALVGDLRGDGPDWLYGSSAIGDERVHATSSSPQPLFIGIGRSADVDRYLAGVAHATIEGFEVTSRTTHTGGPPPWEPSRGAIWAASTEGAGEQTLLWTPRDGDWSVVFMNADGSRGVSVDGDASATLPVLPWIAGVLLLLAAVSGFLGARLVLHARRQHHPADFETHNPPAERVSVGAGSASEVTQ